jgi:hypothetical protein
MRSRFGEAMSTVKSWKEVGPLLPPRATAGCLADEVQTTGTSAQLVTAMSMLSRGMFPLHFPFRDTGS